ncbi:conserved hypothetical protein [Trichinella spiralis]|uniref:hypothetical protein n=1 Tax=Trichinella spiralis TaxID=6334 RepID=UPI0001EFDDF3|nr:conserved hypothetical protein [Trichinella spiralis]
MLTAFSNISNLFNQGNSPNQKPLSILEFLLTMKRTLRRIASNNQGSYFLQNYPATGLLRICPKPFYLRMDQSDAGPAMYQLPRQACFFRSNWSCTYQPQQDKGGEHWMAFRENNDFCIPLLLHVLLVSRFVSFSCFMHTRFKWYNIRRPAVDPKQADPTYYENLALSVPLAQGYIDRLGEIWFEMVSVSRDHDSTHWLPHVDIKQPKAEYESVKALETYVVLSGFNGLPYFSAPDSVKKLFSIEFGRRKDLTFQWKRALMNKVRQNELDTSSLEVRIAKHTALIRHWSKLLSEMKSFLRMFRLRAFYI